MIITKRLNILNHFILEKRPNCYVGKQEAVMFHRLRKLLDKNNLMLTRTVSCMDFIELSNMKPLRDIEYRGQLMKHVSKLSPPHHNKLGDDVCIYARITHAKSENILRDVFPVPPQYPVLPVKLDMISMKVTLGETNLEEDIEITENNNLSNVFQEDGKVKNVGFFKRLRKRIRKFICF